eukprot:2286900-Rhodomonas_salina.1
MALGPNASKFLQKDIMYPKYDQEYGWLHINRLQDAPPAWQHYARIGDSWIKVPRRELFDWARQQTGEDFKIMPLTPGHTSALYASSPEHFQGRLCRDCSRSTHTHKTF